jgi:2-dehydro-3-deoxyphosphooctonate aldolase (KDO 8-P synthase)
LSLYKKMQNNAGFFLIAGPCVIESEETAYEIALALKNACQQRDILFIFKASYLKANRTSGSSFSGPGLDRGLKILNNIKTSLNVPVLTDVHEVTEAERAAEVVDVIQIPAFLARQTFLLEAAAGTGKIVNIKKGQFMAPEDMEAAAAKITSKGNHNIVLTERGTSFGYHNLIVDFRSFQIMKQFGFPVVYDVTHSLQRPSNSAISGGNPEFVPMMGKAALATNMVNGIFLETHPEPAKAKSDSQSMIKLESISDLLDSWQKTKE